MLCGAVADFCVRIVHTPHKETPCGAAPRARRAELPDAAWLANQQVTIFQGNAEKDRLRRRGRCALPRQLAVVKVTPAWILNRSRSQCHEPTGGGHAHVATRWMGSKMRVGPRTSSPVRKEGTRTNVSKRFEALYDVMYI